MDRWITFLSYSVTLAESIALFKTSGERKAPVARALVVTSMAVEDWIR
jgi:hypothetical protein